MNVTRKKGATGERNRGGRPRKPVPGSEAEFLASVREAAQLRGWATYHTYDSQRSEPGFPDLVLVRGTRLVFAELKAGRGRATVEQTAWLAALKQTGVETYLWHARIVWPDEVLRVLA